MEDVWREATVPSEMSGLLTQTDYGLVVSFYRIVSFDANAGCGVLTEGTARAAPPA